jgi:mevalonate kinase
VVTAVDQRLFVTIEKNGVDMFNLVAPDLGLKAYSKTIKDLGNKELPKAVRFIEILYKNFLQKYPQPQGINVTTKSDFSASFGFGSSSAVTVAFAKGLTELYQISLTKSELFEMCYQTITEVQGVGSGFDIAAAIWGGTILYVTPAAVVEPIQFKKQALSDHLVVGYTGVKADTPTLIRMVDSFLAKDPAKINHIFDQIGTASEQIKTALSQANWSAAGQVFNQHQSAVRQLKVSTPDLEKMITAATKAGAYGATLSGAGGGDCMLALVEPAQRDQVEQAITQAGGEVISVAVDAPGVRVE